MTKTLLPVRPLDLEAAAPESMRCDVCGRPVADPRRHVVACVERELAMFAAGRRAN